MRWPKSVKWVDVPIYGGKVAIVETHKQYNALLQAMKVDAQHDLPRAGCTQTFQCKEDDGTTIYTLGLFEREPGTLAHEIAHICFNVFDRVGANPEDGRCNEAFCYLLGWLVWKITEALD